MARLLPDYDKKNAINLILVVIYGQVSGVGILIGDQIRTNGGPNLGTTLFFFACLGIYGLFIYERSYLFNGVIGSVEQTETRP